MTPPEQCREAGLDSFAELTRISGMHEQTLRHWFKNKPQQFACMVAGASAIKYGRNSRSSLEGDIFLKKWLLLDKLSPDDQEIIARIVNRFMEDK